MHSCSFQTLKTVLSSDIHNHKQPFQKVLEIETNVRPNLPGLRAQLCSKFGRVLVYPGSGNPGLSTLFHLPKCAPDSPGGNQRHLDRGFFSPKNVTCMSKILFQVVYTPWWKKNLPNCSLISQLRQLQRQQTRVEEWAADNTLLSIARLLVPLAACHFSHRPGRAGLTSSWG